MMNNDNNATAIDHSMDTSYNALSMSYSRQDLAIIIYLYQTNGPYKKYRQ